jgi:putative endonuclease
MNKLHFGWEVERRAEGWLLARSGPGTRVAARNFRCKSGEIDLVLEVPLSGAGGGTELVFVEVRARTAASSWVDGIGSVSFPKQRRLAKAIRIYLAGYRGPARRVRLDLLAWDGREWTHLRNVWLPDGL